MDEAFNNAGTREEYNATIDNAGTQQTAQQQQAIQQQQQQQQQQTLLSPQKQLAVAQAAANAKSSNQIIQSSINTIKVQVPLQSANVGNQAMMFANNAIIGSGTASLNQSAMNNVRPEMMASPNIICPDDVTINSDASSISGQYTTLNTEEEIEALSAIKEIDRKCQERRIQYHEIHDITENEKSKIIEKLRQLEPMYKNVDSILPYFWHYTRSGPGTFRLLGMKYMIEQQLDALPGKFLLRLELVDNLIQQFRKYFDFVESRRRGIEDFATNVAIRPQQPKLSNKRINNNPSGSVFCRKRRQSSTEQDTLQLKKQMIDNIFGQYATLNTEEEIEALSAIKEIDRKAQEQRIQYHEIHFTEDEKSKILEKLRQLEPMYKDVDRILPYFWYYTRSSPGTFRLLGMKYMVEQQFDALPGKFLFGLELVDNLIQQFREYFDFVESRRRGIEDSAAMLKFNVVIRPQQQPELSNQKINNDPGASIVESKTTPDVIIADPHNTALPKISVLSSDNRESPRTVILDDKLTIGHETPQGNAFHKSDATSEERYTKARNE